MQRKIVEWLKAASVTQSIGGLFRSMAQQRRSNVENWKALQSGGYFENHPEYGAFSKTGGAFDLAKIGEFFHLRAEYSVVVVGCGYGRETLHIAPQVRRVYGIDVSREILNKAVGFLSGEGVTNFTPVEAEHYEAEIPSGVDLVYSMVVMQHLTRDLVRDYVKTLGGKLAPEGRMLIQFIHELFEGVEEADAVLADQEPSISWTLPQLVQLANECEVEIVEVRTVVATPTCLWHWVLFKSHGT